jgi:hypothetical protein
LKVVEVKGVQFGRRDFWLFYPGNHYLPSQCLRAAAAKAAAISLVEKTLME